MAKNTKNNTIGIQPLGDRVLLKAVTAAEQVKGGIIIPDSAKEKPQEAEVVALGTGGKDKDGKPITFCVKVGDKVIVSKYAGTEVKYNDVSYSLIREEDILAIVE